MPQPPLKRAASLAAAAAAVAGVVVGVGGLTTLHRSAAARPAVAAPAATQATQATPAHARSATRHADRAVRPAPLRLHRPDLLVLLPRAAAPGAVARLDRQTGVRAVAVLDRGAVRLAGRRLTILGGDPVAIRGLTPSLTARSDELWRSVARGELTLSYARAQAWRRRLGAVLPVQARQGYFPLRLGAFASLGLGTADGLVDRVEARTLGLRPARELVVSAPGVDLDRLRGDVHRIFGARLTMLSLRPKPVDQTTLLSAYAQATIPASYLALYRAAATTCAGLPWTVLAAIGAVETGHGANTHVSSKGAMGPMQFLPSTFAAYAVDGDRDGVADIHDPDDAVYTAARYLCHAGAGLGGQSLYDAIWAYNHADWYVRKVLSLAVAYS